VEGLDLPSIGCYPLEQPEEEGQVEHPERRFERRLKGNT